MSHWARDILAVSQASDLLDLLDWSLQQLGVEPGADADEMNAAFDKIAVIMEEAEATDGDEGMTRVVLAGMFISGLVEAGPEGVAAMVFCEGFEPGDC